MGTSEGPQLFSPTPALKQPLHSEGKALAADPQTSGAVLAASPQSWSPAGHLGPFRRSVALAGGSGALGSMRARPLPPPG